MASDQSFSRRRFLGVLAGTVAASALPAAGAVQAATSAPRAAGTVAAPAQPAQAGEVLVWQVVDFIPQTKGLIKERMEQVASEKGIRLLFEELPSNPASNDRFIAAVQAGTPPDIWRTYDYQIQYWRIQNQTADIADIVRPYTTQAGGFWDPVTQTASYRDGWYGVPLAVNCWPMHVRQDLLDQNNLTYPKNWDEFREQGRQLTRPPVYYYGHTLGRINDTNNHFLGMLWTFGGKLQNDDGTLATREGDEAWLSTIDLIVKMYQDDRIIPPGSVNWDDTHNNQGYQSEQLVVTSNPTSIYNWLRLNKPDLAQKTKFYNYPAGPAGSFGQVDVWAESLFKNGKGGEGARVLLNAIADPAWYGEYILKLAGRFVPVYKNMIDDPFWSQNDLYTEYRGIITNGRIMSYSSAPLGAISELTTNYLIGDLMQDVLVKRVRPAEALATFVKSAQEIYAKPENQR